MDTLGVDASKPKVPWTDRQILDMVGEATGRLDPRIYCDESLYELELERVFGRS